MKYSVFLLCFLLPFLATAEEAKSPLEPKEQAALDDIMTPIKALTDERDERIRIRAAIYVADLAKLEKEIASDGDLDGALMARKEADAWKDGEAEPTWLGLNDKIPQALRELRSTCDNDIADLRSKSATLVAESAPPVADRLRKIEKGLTKLQRLDAALYIRKEKDAIEALILQAGGEVRRPGANRLTSSRPKLEIPVRPTHPGRIKVWPISRKAKNNDGIGTLPPELARATDIVAISANQTNEAQQTLPAGIGLALHADGKVSRWGHFTLRGKDAKPGTLYPAPSEVRDIVSIHTSSVHCAAITARGKVVCWGFNGGVNESKADDVRNIVGVALASFQTLVLDRKGRVTGWGDESDILAIPEKLENVVRLVATSRGARALLADGSIIGWGNFKPDPAKKPLPVRDYIDIAIEPSVGLTAKGEVVPFSTLDDEYLAEIAALKDIVKITTGNPIEGKFLLAAMDDGGIWHFVTDSAYFDKDLAARESAGCADIAIGGSHFVGLTLIE